jgi:hypothetical protein
VLATALAVLKRDTEVAVRSPRDLGRGAAKGGALVEGLGRDDPEGGEEGVVHRRLQMVPEKRSASRYTRSRRAVPLRRARISAQLT